MTDDLQVLSKQIYSQRCSAHASAFLQTQLVEEEMKEISSDKNKVCFSKFILRNDRLFVLATVRPKFIMPLIRGTVSPQIDE